MAWKDSPECLIVDPGYYSEDEKRAFKSFVSGQRLKPEAILLTHAHPDHIFGVKDVLDTYGQIPVYMDDKELCNLEYGRTTAARLGLRIPDCSFVTTPVEDGDVIRAAGMEFTAISTPGHAPGSMCYLEKDEKVMFTGDTLFAGTIGRTDLMYSEYDDEIRSIMEKLVILPGDIRIIPGHGHESTIGWEREHNPFLEPFNEPEEEIDPDAPPVIIHG